MAPVVTATPIMPPIPPGTSKIKRSANSAASGAGRAANSSGTGPKKVQLNMPVQQTPIRPPAIKTRAESVAPVTGRHSRNSTGNRLNSVSDVSANRVIDRLPYDITPSFILKKHAGKPPSLVLHLHPNHFKFDQQDGVFPYQSPMRMLLQHIRSRTIPHDLIPFFTQWSVPFYDGCLIVQVHDHRSAAQEKETSKQELAEKKAAQVSIHNYSSFVTPSPYVPFPLDNNSVKSGGSSQEDKDKVKSEIKSKKLDQKSRVFTVVLLPTPETMLADLLTKAITPLDKNDPPPTPGVVPPTPNILSAKRPKTNKMEVDGSNIREVEAAIILRTTSSLFLEPVKTPLETIALLEAFSHSKHQEKPPEPKRRKRTVAEMEADEAFLADQERFMHILDERVGCPTSNAQNANSSTDAEASAAAKTFERFTRLKDLQRSVEEKRLEEKAKQAEKQQREEMERKAQVEQERQAELERQRAAQQQQQLSQQRLRETQSKQVTQKKFQGASMLAKQPGRVGPNGQIQNTSPTAQNFAAQRVAASQAQNQAQVQTNTQQNSNNGPPSQVASQVQGTPQMANSVPPNGTPVMANANGIPSGNNMRFPGTQNVPVASSPVVRNGTPIQASSPMLGGVNMQSTASNIAGSPSRPPSSMQHGAVPMSVSMSDRSHQSHNQGTPRMAPAAATPTMSNMSTPGVRPTMVPTPRIPQTSPPPVMSAAGSNMGTPMFNNGAVSSGIRNTAMLVAQQSMAQKMLQAQQQHAAMNGPSFQGMTQQQQQHFLMQQQAAAQNLNRQQLFARMQQQQPQMVNGMAQNRQALLNQQMMLQQMMATNGGQMPMRQQALRIQQAQMMNAAAANGGNQASLQAMLMQQQQQLQQQQLLQAQQQQAQQHAQQQAAAMNPMMQQQQIIQQQFVRQQQAQQQANAQMQQMQQQINQQQFAQILATFNEADNQAVQVQARNIYQTNIAKKGGAESMTPEQHEAFKTSCLQIARKHRATFKLNALRQQQQQQGGMNMGMMG